VILKPLLKKALRLMGITLILLIIVGCRRKEVTKYKDCKRFVVLGI
jgi:hypothetical protein